MPVILPVLGAASDVIEEGISATGGVETRCGHDAWGNSRYPFKLSEVRVYILITRL